MYVYIASPSEIEAWQTLYNWPIVDWKCNGWIKVIASGPLYVEEEKIIEHPFKKFK